MKKIRFTEHAKLQMHIRGATETEVESTVEKSEWQKAKQNRFHAIYEVVFNSISPVNNKLYNFKILDVVFVDEPDEIVVITVKVYYRN